MPTSKWFELGEGLAFSRLESARARAGFLITDRPAKKFDQTRMFVQLLSSLNGQSVTLARGLKVYVYAKSPTDVERRPAKSARSYYLPKGTVLSRELINGRPSVTARTNGYARMVMSRPTRESPMVKVHTAVGFVESTGRGAGFRSGGRGGPTMDKSTNA